MYAPSDKAVCYVYLQRHAQRKLGRLLLQVRGFLGGVSRRGADEVDHWGAVFALFSKLCHVADLNHWHHMHRRRLHGHLGLHMPARARTPCDSIAMQPGLCRVAMYSDEKTA